jgi:hypothetical protein
MFFNICLSFCNIVRFRIKICMRDLKKIICAVSFAKIGSVIFILYASAPTYSYPRFPYSCNDMNNIRCRCVTSFSSPCNFMRFMKIGAVRGTFYLKALPTFCYSDWLLAERSGDRIPVGARCFAPIQTGPEVHPASCTTGNGSFPGVKRPGDDADLSPLLVPMSKNRVGLYLYSS